SAEPVSGVDAVQQPACIADAVGGTISYVLFDQGRNATDGSRFPAHVTSRPTDQHVALFVESDLSVRLPDQERRSADGRDLHPLLWIKDRVISVHGFALHVPVQSRVFEGCGPEHLLCRCSTYDDVQQGNARSMY